jgi:hypothetical protein
MEALAGEKDAGGREKAAALLKTLMALQAGLSAPPPAPKVAAVSVPKSEGYELYKLPSGVEVLTRTMENGKVSDNYYCPDCFRRGKTVTLEFRFGGGRNYPVLALAPLASPPPPSAPPPSSEPPPSSAPPSPSPPPPDFIPPPMVLGAAGGLRSWRVSRSAGVELEAPKDYTPTRARFLRWWTNFGQGGFLTSVFFHLILAIVVMTWVIAVQAPRAEEPALFDTSAGGPKGDASIHFADKTKQKTIRQMARHRPPKIALAKSASVSLPEVMPIDKAFLHSSEKGSLAAGLGGSGRGFSLGSGNGNFFTPGMVMGLRIHARNMAVYLDNSGSMIPYLKPVKAEILKSFPNADIYEHDGIRIAVRDGRVEFGRRIGNSIFVSSEVSNSKEYLLEKYRQNFDAGSIGAWMDIMLFQGYDALVIFSDFQDGVEQDGAGRGRIFSDTPYSKLDQRIEADKAWEKEWILRCKQKPGGPRIYLFSIEVVPQKIWQDCVKASGGAVRMKPNLRVESR